MLFITFAFIAWSKLFKLVFIIIIYPKLNARTKLIRNFSPPE